MFAFGCAITSEEIYDRCAAPGFELAKEPDTPIIARLAVGSIFRSYNMLLDVAKEQYPDLEALVIVHQDSEIVDPDFIPKVREALRDPDVALVGCAGAIDVRSIAWWEGAVTWASFTHVFDDFGGGEIPGISWAPEKIPVYAETGEVQTIDGFVIAFSPWAIENLRFDESIGGVLHGYDFDICMQAHLAGKKVVTAPMRVAHHHSLILINEAETWIAAHMKLAEKWDEQLPAVNASWEERARRAEAELSATRLAAGSGRLIWEMRLGQLEERIEELEARNRALEGSLSWRLTKPLRKITSLIRGGNLDEQPPTGADVSEDRPALPASAAPSHNLPSPSPSSSVISEREKAGLPR
ncbi:MAG: glycosyltransferase [Solirubrobacterales bacterium]